MIHDSYKNTLFLNYLNILYVTNYQNSLNLDIFIILRNWFDNYIHKLEKLEKLLKMKQQISFNLNYAHKW